MRYVGQSFELAIPTPARRRGRASTSLNSEHFPAAPDRAYGFSAPREPAECVSVAA